MSVEAHAMASGNGRPSTERHVVTPDDFARVLWHARRTAGLSQTALARRSGYSQRQITELEQTRHRPRTETALDLLEALGGELRVTWFGDPASEPINAATWRDDIDCARYGAGMTWVDVSTAAGIDRATLYTLNAGHGLLWPKFLRVVRAIGGAPEVEITDAAWTTDAEAAA